MKPSSFFVFLVLLCSLVMADGHVAVDEMAAAAKKLLGSLNDEQKAKTTFAFKADERMNWHFIPKTRQGLTIGQMNAEQRKLAHALLRSALSEQGYNKTTNIMSLEAILRDLEGPNSRMVRDPELYYFSIFGEPSAEGTWGWRVEGHHLSVNTTIVNGRAVAATPSFFGSNPANVRKGPRQGLRVLAGEEDLGRELVKALNTQQRKEALIAEEAPKDIITGAERKVKPLEQVGVVHEALDQKQRLILLALVKEYVFRYRPEVADDDLKEIEKAGWEKVRFAWAGGIEPGQPHYYRVQGPTFLLEYDNTQNDANHVHAVWRSFDGDFGEDLLRQHYDKDHAE